MNRIDAIGSSPTIDVLIDRTRVWFTARFTVSENVRVDRSVIRDVFSRILSNTTTVSYRE